MFGWLNSLSSSGFMPHGHCYLWRSDILWTHIISDATIALSYYAIPFVLGILLLRRKKMLPFKGIVWLFVAFIFLCGTTHLLRIYVTWVPAYEIEGWLKALTALVSLITALVLTPKLPALLRLPDLKTALDRSEQALADLKDKNKELDTVYSNTMNREDRIIELKAEVNTLRNRLGESKKYLIDEEDVSV